MDAPVIERDVDLDMPADELWELISTSEGWRQWLVDDASVSVREGAGGEVVDDGVRRHVAIEHVGQGEVRFLWTADGEVSRVTIAIDEREPARVRLRITEEWLSPTACADCPLRASGRWELRECLLCLRTLATCRV